MAGNVSFFLAGTGALNSFTAIRVRAGTKKLALVLLGRYVLMAGTNLYYLCVCRILIIASRVVSCELCCFFGYINR